MCTDVLDDCDCGLDVSEFRSGKFFCCHSLAKVSIDLIEPLQVFLSWLWSDIALRMRVLDGGERSLRNRGSVWCLRKLWDIRNAIDHNRSLGQLFDRFRALVKDLGRNTKCFAEKVKGVPGLLGFIARENEAEAVYAVPLKDLDMAEPTSRSCLCRSCLRNNGKEDNRKARGGRILLTFCPKKPTRLFGGELYNRPLQDVSTASRCIDRFTLVT